MQKIFFHELLGKKLILNFDLRKTTQTSKITPFISERTTRKANHTPYMDCETFSNVKKIFKIFKQYVITLSIPFSKFLLQRIGLQRLYLNNISRKYMTLDLLIKSINHDLR